MRFGPLLHFGVAIIAVLVVSLALLLNLGDKSSSNPRRNKKVKF